MRLALVALGSLACAPACTTLGESSLADVTAPSAPALDASKPMTLDDVAAFAVAHNPDLAASRAALPVHDAEATRAGVWPDPTITASVAQPVTPTTDSTGAVVGGDWDVSDVIAKGAAHDAALAAADAARLSVKYQELVVANEARLQATKVAFLTKERDVAAAARDAADALLHNAEAARATGDATIEDVGVKQASASEADAKALETSSQLLDAQHALAKLIGVAPSTSFAIETPSVADASADDDAKNVDAWFAKAINARADLIALRRAYEGHEQTLRAAVLSQFPRFSLHVEGTRDTGGFYTAGGGVTLSLPIFDGNRATVAVERATRDQLRAEYSARLFETRAEIADALAARRVARQGRDALAKRLPALEKVESEMRAALAAHNTTAAAYAEVQSAWFAAQLRLLALADDEVEARIALETATGNAR